MCSRSEAVLRRFGVHLNLSQFYAENDDDKLGPRRDWPSKDQDI